MDEDDPDNTLRVWVKKEDEVVFKSVDSREKSFELSSSANKKATQTDIDKALRSINQDVDRAGGASGETDLLDIAKAMVRGGVGSTDVALGGRAAFIGELMDLQSSEEEEEEGAHASDRKATGKDGKSNVKAEQSGSEESDDDGVKSVRTSSSTRRRGRGDAGSPPRNRDTKYDKGSDKKSAKKAKWFNRDQFVADEKRKLTTRLDKMSRPGGADQEHEGGLRFCSRCGCC